MKKILSLIVALCMMVSTVPAMAEDAVELGVVQAKNTITITVDAKRVDCSVYNQEPVIVNGRTLVPLRAVFEALGATVEWNNDTRTATAQRGGVNVSLAVDSDQLYVNSVAKTIDVPAQIMNNRTMVPVRAVAEAFGCKVEWDNNTRTVVITTEEAVSDNNADTPEEVVKKALDAIFALDFEALSKYMYDTEAEGEMADLDSLEDYMEYMTGEEITAEEAEYVAMLYGKLASLIIFKITGSEINGEKATVTMEVSVPDFESINVENYITQESVLLIYAEVLAGRGYTLENLESITGYELDAITAEVQLATILYAFEEIVKNADELPKVTQTDTAELIFIDGKWLIVEETEETITLYSIDGRTISVFESEVDDYLALGWYETEEDAKATNEYLNTNTNKTDLNNLAADGYYYRTPTGKRYHLDPDCGGKNSYRTENISGLTPCLKCAK